MQNFNVSQYLKAHIRTVSDWPAPGVQFRDITPLLQDPKVFRVLIDAFVHRYMDAALRPSVVAGLDARGFILGAVLMAMIFILGLMIDDMHWKIRQNAKKNYP